MLVNKRICECCDCFVGGSIGDDTYWWCRAKRRLLEPGDETPYNCDMVLEYTMDKENAIE